VPEIAMEIRRMAGKVAGKFDPNKKRLGLFDLTP
jgi:hypothetical protein